MSVSLDDIATLRAVFTTFLPSGSASKILAISVDTLFICR